MRQINWTLALIFFFNPFSKLNAQSESRNIISYNKNWKFYLGEVSNPNDSGFNDSQWRKLALPHDWSIEGKFDKNNPAGTGGGALPGGVGWYRKQFTLPIQSKRKNIFIDFDGIYRQSQVWINGHLLGKRPSGYISFRYDLTPYLKYGNGKNTIVVKVDNSQQPNSRWYSGSGIYRNVWLTTTGKIFVDHWGTFITTPAIKNGIASVYIGLKINNSGSQDQMARLKTTIFNAAGAPVNTVSSSINLAANTVTETAQETTVSYPRLWSVDDPYLYKAVTEISYHNQTV